MEPGLCLLKGLRGLRLVIRPAQMQHAVRTLELELFTHVIIVSGCICSESGQSCYSTLGEASGHIKRSGFLFDKKAEKLCKWPHIKAQPSLTGKAGLSLNKGQTAGKGQKRDYHKITTVRGKLK